MVLCDKCSALGADISNALHGLEANSSDAADHVPSPWSISDWHDCLQDIYRASSRCSVCALAVKGWRQHRPVIVQSSLMSGDIPPDDQPPDLHDDILDIRSYQNGWIEVEVQRNSSGTDGDRKVQFFLEIKCRPKSRASWDACDELISLFRMASENGSVSSAVRLDTLVSPDPLSAQALRVPREWLRVCDGTHESCTAKSSRLPTRLLDIGDPSSGPGCVVLREPKSSENNADDRYVALSHCWGRGQNICTTQATLESHKRGIDIQSLPQTFKDAIAIVRSLGVRYLWIDSLCIIQGDLHDWQVESAKMATVYRDAYLVLGAARGESDTQGFLGSRLRADEVVLTLPSAAETLSLLLQPPAALRWTNGGGGEDPVCREPLSKRAWCLQERYLPRRMLLYGSEQAFWECNRTRASEDGDSIPRHGDQLARIGRTANIPTSVFNRSSRDLSGSKDGVNHLDWYVMIEDYTRRGITAASDRLPALIGLVKAMTQCSKDDYMAGVWKSSLIEGLMWCGSQGAETLRHPGEYIAPSWSWASVAGAVQFPMYTWYDRATWMARMSDFEALASYVEHGFQLRDLEPEGRLKHGWLRVKGALLPVVSVEPHQETPPRMTQYFGQEPNRSPFTNRVIGLQVRTPPKATEIWVEGGFDKPTESRSNRQLFVIFLSRLPFILEDGFIDHRFGLIVEKAGASEQYSRVGFVDGCLLWKAHSKVRRLVMKWRHGRSGSDYEVAGFPRPPLDENATDDLRPNDQANNPLQLEEKAIILV